MYIVENMRFINDKSDDMMNETSVIGNFLFRQPEK